MTKYYEENTTFCEKENNDIFIRRNKIGDIYYPDEVKEINFLPQKTQTKEKKDIQIKCNFSRKNYVLKSEICKDHLNSNERYSPSRNDIKNNAIINYFYSGNSIQPKSKNYNLDDDFKFEERKIQENIKLSQDNSNYVNSENKVQNLNFQEFNKNKINQDYNYNLSEINKENKIINNNNSPDKNNKQIYSNLINNIYNIINMNNYYYPNRNYNMISNPNVNTKAINSQILLIKDKIGCIVMKNKIMADPNYANEILFPQITADIKDLCCDNFGNYFLQAFLDIITFDNLNKFLDIINKDFIEICLSNYGTRVVQKVIDKISYTPILVNKFTYLLNRSDFGLICNSQYGNHIIQKFVTTIHNPDYTSFIYNYIYQNFLEIANDKHGVFIIQKCISEGNDIQREKIYKIIENDFINIIKNEFGNYLIQFILINNKNEQQYFKEILPIIIKIEENLINLCMSKFSANAIEKCFEKSDNIIRNHILETLFNKYSDKIIDILFNKFGIYVILKAARAQNGKYTNKLIDIFHKNINELRFIINSNTKNSRKILKIVHSHKELDNIYEILKNNLNDNNNEEKLSE